MVAVVTQFIGYNSAPDAPKLTAAALNAAFGLCAPANPTAHAQVATTLTGNETVSVALGGIDYQVPLSVLLALSGGSGGTVTSGIPNGALVDDYSNAATDDYTSYIVID